MKFNLIDAIHVTYTRQVLPENLIIRIESGLTLVFTDNRCDICSDTCCRNTANSDLQDSLERAAGGRPGSQHSRHTAGLRFGLQTRWRVLWHDISMYCCIDLP